MRLSFRSIMPAIALGLLSACATEVSVPTATLEPQSAETRVPASAPENMSVSSPAGQATVPGIRGGSGAAITLYVAPNGNDAWSGTLPSSNAAQTDGPFGTFDRARRQVQSLDKAGRAQITVQFRGGTYFLPATEQFTESDSGGTSTKIVYENYPGEAPVISGGVRVQDWVNVSGNIWRATLPASTQYFENLFYNGVRRLRPRLGGYLGTYLRVAATIYLNAPAPPATPPDPNCSVYVAGKGWECFDRFQYNPTDPIVNTWRNLAPATNNTCHQPAGNPALAGDIELLDFEQFSASKLRISCIDTASHIVYLTGATVISSTAHTAYGFIAKHRYLIENVRDALTQPGQWFLDRSTNPWTLTYLANPGENPNADTVVIPQLTQVLVASNLQDVTFQGLTFAHDNYTLPAMGQSFPQVGLNISAAVSFQNSQHITFDSDSVAHTSGAGLEFISCIDARSPSWCISDSTSAVTSGNIIENSAFYDTGFAGIRIGMPGHPGDTDTNIPQFTTVQNNVVEGYGRIFPDTFGINQGNGHDNVYTHNDVYDGYHTAIGICFCAGNLQVAANTRNNIISFNHVYNLFQGIMNDAGSIYIRTANSSTTGTGNKILNNKVHDVSDASALDADGYGGEGLYVDDYAGSVDMENNLVYRVSGNAVNFSGPRSGPDQVSTIKNNVFAFTRESIIGASNPYSLGTVPPAPLFFTATNNLFYFDRSAASTPAFHVQGGCAYSGSSAYTAFQQWNSNLYWRTDGGFANDTQAFHVQPSPATNAPCFFSNPATKWTFFNLAGWQKLGEDVQSVVRNPGFANPAYPADDYALPNGSPGVGFVVFDPSQAGRSNPVLHPPEVPATFQTKTFDPAKDY